MERTLSLCRQLYNAALQERREGREDGRLLRTEEVSARDTHRAAGVQGHSFPGPAERHRAGR
nr:hypothetical protein [Allomeiothermus silvanus]